MESNDIVPFNQFYIPEIQEKVDIKADLFNWLQTEVRKKHFCPELQRVALIPQLIFYCPSDRILLFT